ncbi:MAG: toll/interleukin-1 receptor domain-containing protein [Chitinophagaceae bacterium]
MKTLDTIEILRPEKPARLELLKGDLSALPFEHKVDILVISAFPDDYTALPGSLMLALKEKGLSIKELSDDKAVDLRDTLGCWLSRPLSLELQDIFHFRQIVCFEPGTHTSNPVEVVGNIFRCLNNFVFAESNNRIAMPVIGSGYQQVPFQKMLPALIETSCFWLEHGLPIDVIKIVIFSDRHVAPARILFDKAKFENELSAVSTREEFEEISPGKSTPTIKNRFINTELDYFISYAHTHAIQVQHFVDSLLKINPTLKIFYDKTSIAPGGLWIRHISDAIIQAKKVIIFLSPDYSASMICWDEFQCAKLKEYNNKSSHIQTIYLHNDPTLPVIMGIHSYIDCREGDLLKLAAACEQLLNDYQI